MYKPRKVKYSSHEAYVKELKFAFHNEQFITLRLYVNNLINKEDILRNPEDREEILRAFLEYYGRKDSAIFKKTFEEKFKEEMTYEEGKALLFSAFHVFFDKKSMRDRKEYYKKALKRTEEYPFFHRDFEKKLKEKSEFHFKDKSLEEIEQYVAQNSSERDLNNNAPLHFNNISITKRRNYLPAQRKSLPAQDNDILSKYLKKMGLSSHSLYASSVHSSNVHSLETTKVSKEISLVSSSSQENNPTLGKNEFLFKNPFANNHPIMKSNLSPAVSHFTEKDKRSPSTSPSPSPSDNIRSSSFFKNSKKGSKISFQTSANPVSLHSLSVSSTQSTSLSEAPSVRPLTIYPTLLKAQSLTGAQLTTPRVTIKETSSFRKTLPKPIINPKDFIPMLTLKPNKMKDSEHTVQREKNNNIDSRDDNGDTYLHFLIKQYPHYALTKDLSLKKIDLFLNNNANVNLNDKHDNYPLHTVVACGDREIIDLLLRPSTSFSITLARPMINVVNKKGETPLICAIKENKQDIFTRLMSIYESFKDSDALEKIYANYTPKHQDFSMCRGDEYLFVEYETSGDTSKKENFYTYSAIKKGEKELYLSTKKVTIFSEHQDRYDPDLEHRKTYVYPDISAIEHTELINHYRKWKDIFALVPTSSDKSESKGNIKDIKNMIDPEYEKRYSLIKELTGTIRPHYDSDIILPLIYSIYKEDKKEEHTPSTMNYLQYKAVIAHHALYRNFKSRHAAYITDLNYCDSKRGHSPLYYAIKQKDNFFLEKLSEAGIKPYRIIGESVTMDEIYYAIEHQKRDKLDIIEKYLNEEDRNILIRASLEMIEKIVLKNKHVGRKDTSSADEIDTYIEIIKKFLTPSFNINVKNKKGNNFLHSVMYIPDDKTIVSILEDVLRLKKGENVDIETQNILGQSPIHLAAQYGHSKTVKLLYKEYKKLKNNASPSPEQFFNNINNNNSLWVSRVSKHSNDARDEAKPFNQKDRNGNTPLIYAVQGGHFDIVETFLMIPALDINACNNEKYDASHYADRLKNDQVFKTLVTNKLYKCSPFEGPNFGEKVRRFQQAQPVNTTSLRRSDHYTLGSHSAEDNQNRQESCFR